MKILYSPGYGAGWYSWNEDYKELLTLKSIIKYIEEGGKPKNLVKNYHELDREHPVVQEMFDELVSLNVDIDRIYFGGIRDLKICNVDSDFRIDEYDGNESVIEVGRDHSIVRLEELI